MLNPTWVSLHRSLSFGGTEIDRFGDVHDPQSLAGRQVLKERVIRIGSMNDEDSHVDFWLDKLDRERVHAFQICRDACVGRAAVFGRLARVLEVVDGA